MTKGSTQPLTEMSTGDIPWGCTGGQYVQLTTLPPSCVESLQILGASTSWSPKGLCRDSFALAASEHEVTVIKHFVLYYFVLRRNSSVSFSNDFRFDLEDGQPILTQSIVSAINRKHCRPVLRSDCLTTAAVTTGDDLTQPEPSNVPPCCPRITLSTAGSPFVDQSDRTIQATTVVLLQNCTYPLASNTVMVTVQIWMNCVCNSEDTL